MAGQMRDAHCGAITGMSCFPSEPILVTSSPDNTIKQVSSFFSSNYNVQFKIQPFKRSSTANPGGHTKPWTASGINGIFATTNALLTLPFNGLKWLMVEVKEKIRRIVGGYKESL